MRDKHGKYGYGTCEIEAGVFMTDDCLRVLSRKWSNPSQEFAESQKI